MTGDKYCLIWTVYIHDHGSQSTTSEGEKVTNAGDMVICKVMVVVVVVVVTNFSALLRQCAVPYRTVLAPVISKYNRRQMVAGREMAHLKDMLNSGEEIKSRVNSKSGNFS